MFSFEYTPGSDSENPPVLDVLVEDIDAVSSADFMGRARVELEPLKNQRLRKWFPLSADSEGKKGSSNVRTRRLVFLRLCVAARVDGVERVSAPPLPRLREGASNPAAG